MARGRARKGGKKGSSGPSGAPGARINRIEKYEDTLEEGGVDDFMFKRDQIMFNPQDESDEDEIADQGVEILSLEPKGKGKSRRVPVDEQEVEDDEEEEEVAPRKGRKEKVKPDQTKRGRFGKPIEDSDDSAAEGSGSEASEEDEEGWGRQYYSRPSTRREREDPNAYDEKRQEEKELEEAEVKRLQRKAREELDAGDWGFEGLEGGELVEEEMGKEKETAKAMEPVPESSDPSVLIQYLEKHEPVKIALAREWPLIVRKLEKTAKGIRKMEEEKDSQLFKGLGWLHYQTLLAYASTLAFYIHLAALPADSRPNLSSHPIVPRLLQLKEGLAMLEDLDFDAASVSAHPENPLGKLNVGGLDDEDEDDEELMELMRAKRELIARMQEAHGAPDENEEDEDNSWRAQGLEDGELEELLRDADEDSELEEEEEDEEDEDEDDLDDLDLDDLDGLGDFDDLDDFDEPPKKSPKSSEKSKKKKVAQPSKSSAFVPLSEPAFVSSKSKKSTKPAPQIDDRDLTGDLTILSDADATDKAQRKRSLQFHTSKIASTVARREKARNTRLGGDEDVPYRDRQAARDAALRRNGGTSGEGEALDGKDEWSKEDRKRAREVREEADDDVEDDGYYNLVKRRKEEVKDQRRADHEVREAAHFAGFEDESAEGPRALTRAIEKNRGLTPRRNKASRNPRVKKRQAYEKAKKKVASQRAVYKGGQASLGGRYGGEKTGISTNIKSSRF